MQESQNSPLSSQDAGSGSEPVALFEKLDQETASLFSLVLTSRHIPHILRPCSGRDAFDLLVHPRFTHTAKEEIALYLKENEGFFQKKSPSKTHFRHIRGSLLSMLFISCLMSVTFRYEIRDILLDAGAADSSRIIQGQVWRTVTALFLHADPAHFLSNVFMGGVFFAVLFEETGVGLGWFLVVMGGGLGNYLNALMYGYGHVSIGLSTAVFSSIGTYCSLRALGYGFRGVKEGFKVLLSGIALLGMLGSGGGEGNVDVSAHFYGFLCGLAIGAVAWIIRRNLPVKMAHWDIFFGVCAFLVAVLSWALALTQ